MIEFDAAVTKAKSRAAIISGLDKKFSGDRSQSNLQHNVMTPVKVAAVSKMQNLLKDTSEKARERIEDQIVGKTIVLENIKHLSSKISKPKCFKSLSGRKRLRLGIKKRNYVDPANFDCKLLNSMWMKYVAALSESCKSDAQFQARLQACEMVGADVMIVNSTVKKFIGRKGIVVNETKNTLELVMEEGDIPNEEERSRGETNVEEGDVGGAHVHVGDSGSGTNTSSSNGTVNSEVGGHMGHKGGNEITSLSTSTPSTAASKRRYRYKRYKYGGGSQAHAQADGHKDKSPGKLVTIIKKTTNVAMLLPKKNGEVIQKYCVIFGKEM